MTGDDTSVQIPSDVWAECEARIEGTEFDSVEEYVQFVVTALLDDPVDRRTSEDDSAEVTERLESLGYL